MPEYALRYILSQPAVSTIIPGMRNTKHVAANTAASDLGPLPKDVLEKLSRYRWVRDYYTFDKPAD
jgi:aryl-alcohol dehydrogenase-like predicted oxidoreductase